MRIELKTAGGFAAALTAREYAVDSETLPEPVQHELVSLATAALAEPPAKINPKLRDAMSYEIRIVQPNHIDTIVVYDGGIPPAASRLIKFVKTLAATR